MKIGLTNSQMIFKDFMVNSFDNTVEMCTYIGHVGTTNICEQFGSTVDNANSRRPGLALLRAILKTSPISLSWRPEYCIPV